MKLRHSWLWYLCLPNVCLCTAGALQHTLWGSPFPSQTKHASC